MSLTIGIAMPRKKYGETTFGERLQILRKARSLTQVQLAEAAQTTQRASPTTKPRQGFHQPRPLSASPRRST